MARTGRKRMTLDDPRVERLINGLRLGHFVEEACQHANISKQTYYRWLKEGEALDEKTTPLTSDEQALRDLCDAIKAAELAGQSAALDVIRTAAARGTWQAAAWFLERRNKKWSNRTEITGPDGGPVETLTVDEVDQQLRRLIEETKRGESASSS